MRNMDQTRHCQVRGVLGKVAMPSYTYICHPCNKPFTLRRPFAECDEIAVCPNCGAGTTQRRFEAPLGLIRRRSKANRTRTDSPVQEVNEAGKRTSVTIIGCESYGAGNGIVARNGDIAAYNNKFIKTAGASFDIGKNATLRSENNIIE
jgi:putative FmdB family regulatory protein